jgi:hypothetical protein
MRFFVDYDYEGIWQVPEQHLAAFQDYSLDCLHSATMEQALLLVTSGYKLLFWNGSEVVSQGV